jgi:hypothetical protein
MHTPPPFLLACLSCSYQDAGAVQLYGHAISNVISESYFTRFGGLIAWGQWRGRSLADCHPDLPLRAPRLGPHFDFPCHVPPLPSLPLTLVVVPYNSPLPYQGGRPLARALPTAPATYTMGSSQICRLSGTTTWCWRAGS